MTELSISAMLDSQRDRFAAIWVPWLRDAMGRTPEAEDLQIMAAPDTYYRAQDGEVFVAILQQTVVGAVAIKRLGDAGYEFAKLVVSDEARGFGAGRALVDRCIEFVRERGAAALYLQSFKALDVALSLYRRMGFEDAPAPAGMHVLARTEVIMKLDIAPSERSRAPC